MIEPNRTWTKIWWTEPEPELRFDEPNPNLNQDLMNRTEPEPRFDEPNRTRTEIWRTEPEPELRFDEPNPNLTRSSVRFGSIGTLSGSPTRLETS